MATVATPEVQMAQQFSLRWNNHSSNILQVFQEQFSRELLVDVTLACQGKFLKAHKMVLSACSPYFQELFRVHENPHPIIILNGMLYEDVRAIIEFMYRGEVKVVESELDRLLGLAESLQVKGLSRVRHTCDLDDQRTSQSGPHKADQWSSDEEMAGEEVSPLAQQAGPSSPPAQQPTLLRLRVSDLDRTSAPSPSPSRRKARPAVVRVRLSDDPEGEDDLPATIKVEPPDIRDIDEDSRDGWRSPRLVIDLPEMRTPTKTRTLTSKPLLSRSKAKQCILPTTVQKEGSPSNFESKIPRPPNAFMIFANEWRRKLAFEHPSENNKEISVRLGVMWKGLATEAKEVYYAASRQADLEHKRKYPGYYYSPKEARLRKRLKQRPSTAMEAVQLVRVLLNEEQPAPG